MRIRTALVFAAFLVFIAVSVLDEARSATFQFLNGSLFTQVNQNQPLSDVDVDWGDIPAGKTLAEADIEYAAALASGFVRSGAEIEGVGMRELLLNMGAVTFGNSQSGGRLELVADTATVVPGLSGLYFQIVPSAGEVVGEPGRLVFTWMASGATGSDTTARIDGGFSPSMALTLNNLPPTDPLEGVVWQHDDILFNEVEVLPASEYVGVIDYHIGDVLGMHMGLGVELNLPGVATSSAEVSALMRLSIIPEPMTYGFAVTCMLAMLVSRAAIVQTLN